MNREKSNEGQGKQHKMQSGINNTKPFLFLISFQAGPMALIRKKPTMPATKAINGASLLRCVIGLCCPHPTEHIVVDRHPVSQLYNIFPHMLSWDRAFQAAGLFSQLRAGQLGGVCV